MSVSFENSNTKFNLMKAFAGESQARNRYTFAASQAKKEGFNLIEKVFTITANQEKEHAKLFYNHLSSLKGVNIDIEGGYPIDIYDQTVDLLKCAAHNEYQEYNTVYKAFGDEAKNEGLNEIAELFYNVSKIEKIHGDRFLKLLNLIEEDKLFKSDSSEAWFCLNCGYVHIGKSAPEKCPVCDHLKGYFVRHDWISIR